MACINGKMKYICGVLIILLMAVVCEAGVPAGAVSGFIQARDAHFALNGSPFLFNGFNSYWMMVVASEPSQRYKISSVLREASAAGLTVCRTWAFRDGGYRALQISPGVYDEHIFQGLDFVISEARKYGVRLILALSNNYQDYGGRPQYVKWARSAGVAVNGDDDFYTNAVVKGHYKNHVKKVLTRMNTITGIAYKDDPMIMAWELMNEPRCKVDLSGKTINEWVQEMAPHVKSIDNIHLLGVGMEGFYGDSIQDRKQYNPQGFQVGTDFITNHMIKEIDFATIHAYPDVWLPGQSDYTRMTFLQKWVMSHWTDSKSILKKPLIFAEFGKSKKDASYNAFLNTVYTSIYNFAKNGGTMGGGLVWQIMAKGMESYFDGNEIVLSENPSTRAIIAQQSRNMAVLQHSLNSSESKILRSNRNNQPND
ncbi:mannan endo-1,4-beta-mannosidase 5-like [Corylus avellana]|uniref:mannan endo-1,4-beta-mannosidase 5-like n=1 Tax=Corylus avellana TaxID=13451 RepID=UPI00286CE8D0|nr:mannan endo-1,4-beta-mannosidase 5-like [Corylus avellana]